MVGIGPGNPENMSQRAVQTIKEADVVVGYRPYVELIEDVLSPEQEVIGSGMRQEVKRARKALDEALAGRRVVVVSSGDAGIYGMAGLVLELLFEVNDYKRVDFEVIPGITAASAAAALLGAPLMNDFVVISLSDLLTPWEVILRRVEAAAQGDFVIIFYNPKSKRRVQQIEEARKMLLNYRTASTPVGIVTGAGRAEQRVAISDLAHFLDEEINMFSLVIIGSSQSYVKDGRMITPRGYQISGGEKS